MNDFFYVGSFSLNKKAEKKYSEFSIIDWKGVGGSQSYWTTLLTLLGQESVSFIISVVTCINN